MKRLREDNSIYNTRPDIGAGVFTLNITDYVNKGKKHIEERTKFEPFGFEETKLVI